MENKEILVHYQVGCSGSGNGRWNCVSDAMVVGIVSAMAAANKCNR